jgi:hypothetical protein
MYEYTAGRYSFGDDFRAGETLPDKPSGLLGRRLEVWENIVAMIVLIGVLLSITFERTFVFTIARK